jgi:hypothetical protein
MRRISVLSVLQSTMLSAVISISMSAQTKGGPVQNNNATVARINEIFMSTIKQGDWDSITMPPLRMHPSNERA